MLPVYTDLSYLATKSAYADYGLVYTFIAFMNVFYLYGIDNAFLRFYYLSKRKKEDIFFTAFQILFVTSIFSSAILFLLSETIANVVFNSAGYGFFIKIAAGILFFDTMCNLPYLILRVEEKSVQYTIIKIGRFILELVLNIVFVIYLRLGVKGILYANLIAAVINLLILIPYQFGYLKGKFDFVSLKDLLKFGLPMIPNSIAFLIVEMSDRYLMPRLLNKEILGTYHANYKFGTLMLLVVQAFRTAWQPFFLNIAKNKDAKDVYARVMTYYVLAASFVVLGGGLLVEYVVQIPVAPSKTLLGQEYWSGVIIIPLILLSYMLYGVYVNLTVGIFIEHKSHLMIVFTGLAALVNIGTNFYLMPNFGMMGAAVATVLAYLVMVISIYIANHKIYPVKYEYLRILFIMLYLVSGLTIFYYYSPNIIVRVVMIAMFPVVFLFSNFFSREEKDDFKLLLKKVKSGKK